MEKEEIKNKDNKETENEEKKIIKLEEIENITNISNIDIENIKDYLLKTDYDQLKTEKTVLEIFEKIGFITKNSSKFEGKPKYRRTAHYEFTRKLMNKLSHSYISMDSGYPWFTYWVTNIIGMCKNNYQLSYETKMKFVQILKELQHEEGGFRGVPKGYPHLISTYAAMMSIVNLEIPEAYDIVDITKMRNFLLKMKNNNFEINNGPSFTDKNGIYLITRENKNECFTYKTAFPGTFQNHINGESDLRSTYCALTTASILNLIDYEHIEEDPLTKGVVQNIKKCQTFEGGLGPEPFCEAHGGYSFCGIATLVLLRKLKEIDTDAFVRWLVGRQMSKEGGFNGRTNKLVDSCYSFWQGSIFNLLYMSDENFSADMELLYDQLSLQAYIIYACQREEGGLFDKPGKRPDLFHTNYATAGLILSQEPQIEDIKITLSCNKTLEKQFETINPIYCVTKEKAEKAIQYYANLKK